MPADNSEALDAGDTDVTLYEWDHRNRLTNVEHRALYEGAADQVVGYLYDAFDRRVGKNVDSDGNGSDNSRERYIYDGDDVILDFLDADAGTANYTVAKRYLHGPAVDQILAEEDGSVTITADDRVLWHHADNQGTVRDLIDNTGDHVEHYTYDSYGELVAVTDGAGDPLGNASTRFLYTGRELDTETGLQYNRARWYDPVVGSWISEDPIGELGIDGANLYTYVRNAPTIYVDPSGEFAWIPAAIAVGVYLLWPNPANAPAPGEGAAPSDPHGGLLPAFGAGVGGLVGKAISGASSWCTSSGNGAEASSNNAPAKSHGNKLDDKAAEGYSLRDRNTGRVRKYGETTRGEDAFGAGRQRRYSKDYLKKENVDYVKETSGTKKEMHNWQHQKIITHKKIYGHRPDLNKNDY